MAASSVADISTTFSGTGAGVPPVLLSLATLREATSSLSRATKKSP